MYSYGCRLLRISSDTPARELEDQNAYGTLANYAWGWAGLSFGRADGSLILQVSSFETIRAVGETRSYKASRRNPFGEKGRDGWNLVVIKNKLVWPSFVRGLALQRSVVSQELDIAVCVMRHESCVYESQIRVTR